MAKTYPTIKTVSDQIKNATTAGANTAAIVGGNLVDILDKVQEVDSAKVPTTRQVNSKALSSDIALDKTDIGLGNVDNTSDANKPVSDATNTIVTNHTSRTDNPHTVTKTQVGLGNVDNTSDADKPISNAVDTALDLKADLVGGKVPASQLPAYVDDVLEYANFAAFPSTGESGKIYVDLQYNLTYRWGGSAYTEISKSLALGETSTTAYRGDRGKTAYDHSQLTGNAHGVTAAHIPNTPAGTIAATTVQAAINELDADRVQLETDLNVVKNGDIYIYNYIYYDYLFFDEIYTLDNTYISSANGISFVQSTYKSTDYIECSEILFLQSKMDGSSAVGTAFYDINKEFLYSVPSTNLKIILTGEEAYFRTCQTKTYPFQLSYLKKTKEKIKSYVNSISKQPLNKTEYLNITNGYEKHGLINIANGNFVYSTGYLSTKYRLCDNTYSINSYMDGSSDTGIVFYDINMQYIIGYSASLFNKKDVIRPTNAYYYATSQKLTGEKKLIENNYIKYPINDILKDFDYNLSHLNSLRQSKNILNINNFDTFGGLDYGYKKLFQYGEVNTLYNIFYKSNIFFAEKEYITWFECASNDLIICSGFSEMYRAITNPYKIEVRVHSNIFELYYTLNSTSEKVVFSAEMPFNIVSGNRYMIKIKKYNYSIVFVVSDMVNTFTKTVNKTYLAKNNLNGVFDVNVCIAWGSPFTYVRLGSAYIYSTILNSDYDVAPIVIAFGDSFLEGNTLINAGGLESRYIHKVASDLGINKLVISAKGGEECDSIWLSSFVEEIKMFKSKYALIALGTNNTNFDSYINILNQAIEYAEKTGIDVILTTIAPVGNSSTMQTDTRQSFRISANNYIRGCGKKYVDICKAVTDATETIWKAGYVMPDMIHPSVIGHNAIYERFKYDVPELFNQ